MNGFFHTAQSIGLLLCVSMSISVHGMHPAAQITHWSDTITVVSQPLTQCELPTAQLTQNKQLIAQAHALRQALARGIPINNITDETGELISPVLFAATLKNPRLMEQFLALGASQQVSNTQFASPLHALFNISRDHQDASDLVARLTQHYRTMRPYSLEALIIKQLSHCKPLIKAVELGDEKLVERCLQFGLSVNARDDQGRTALMLATQCPNWDNVISVLIDYGADTTLRDNAGKGAIDFTSNEWVKKILSMPFNNTNNSVSLQYQSSHNAEQTADEIHELYTKELAKENKPEPQEEEQIIHDILHLRARNHTPPLPPENPTARKRQKQQVVN